MDGRRWMIAICAVTMVAAPILIAQCQPASNPVFPFRARVDSVFRHWDSPLSPGCALCIIQNSRIVYSHGYGMADIARGIPISSATVFNVASLSKQYTATSLVLLAQEGKLSLDDDVRNYVPELPDYGKPITIRRLLNHTSGIRDYIQMMFLAGSRHATVVNNNDALRMIVRQKALNFTPGDEHLYSNSGYVLASIILERVTGESLADFEQKRIFRPLGMKHTEIVDDHKRVVPGCAVGYEPQSGGGFVPMIANWEDTGDGNVRTTVEDLYRWDQNFYHPTVGGKDLIDQLTTPDTLNDGTPLQYALGLGVWKYKGLRVVNHEGEWAGFRAEFMRFPVQEFSVIILCNLSTMVPEQLAERVADICLGPDMKKAEQMTVETSTPLKMISLSTDELSRYAGQYRSPAGELIRRIAVRHAGLLYVRGPNSATELAPLGDDKFRMKGVPVVTDVLFTRSASGDISGMQVVSEGTRPIGFVPFTRVIPSPHQVASYAGNYHSDELNADYRVIARDSSLYLHTTYPDNDHLVPTLKDIFKIEDSGIVRFTRGASDAVKGFYFTFGKVRNIEFVRQQTPANSSARIRRKDEP